MANWLFNEPILRGLPVVCIEARQAHAVQSQMHNKTDENDAAMLAELARTGFYKRIEVKSRQAQERRALLRAREIAIKSMMNVENTIRGLLASFGIRLPKHLKTYDQQVRKVLEDQPVLSGIVLPLLHLRTEALRQAASLTKDMTRQDRADEACRRLMTIPGIGAVSAVSHLVGIICRMGAVTSLFLAQMIEATGPRTDHSRLLSSVGLDPDAAADSKILIADSDYVALLERIATEFDVTDLPLRTGASMRLDDYGALGLAFKAASTLGASNARVARFARLWTSVVEYPLESDGAATRFRLHRAGPRRLGLRLSNEATLASATAIAREVSPTGTFIPLEVHLRDAARRSSRNMKPISAARSFSDRTATRS